MIDVHAHIFFDELIGAAGKLGPRFEDLPDGTCQLVTGGMTWPIPNRQSLSVSAGDRVRALDKAGIDLQVVTISPLWLFHHAPVDVATRFARRANDLMAQWCEDTSGRALPLVQLPVQDPDAAADELRRCAADHRVVGAYMGSDARQHLDSPELDPIYEVCQELDLPLFIHSAMPGIDGPAGDPRLERWIGQAVLGYPLEDTVAVSAFLLGDVLDRHPSLDVCFSHGGGAIPLLWGRLQAFASTTRSPVNPSTLQQRVNRLWFDQHLHFDDGVQLLRKVADPDHLVFGSNFGGWDAEHGGDDLDPTLASNAQRLLRL